MEPQQMILIIINLGILALIALYSRWVKELLGETTGLRKRIEELEADHLDQFKRIAALESDPPFPFKRTPAPPEGAKLWAVRAATPPKE